MFKRAIILGLFALVIVSCSSKDQEAKKEPLKGTISFIQGEVKRSKDAAHWVEAKLNDEVLVDDWIQTAYKSFAKVSMWKSTTFTIYPKSKVQIKELAKGKFEMTLEEGKVDCSVQKIASGGHYRVKGPALLAGVRGTEFVFVSDGKKDVLIVKKGIVAVKRNIENAPEILVKPGEKVEISLEENKEIEKKANGKTDDQRKAILNVSVKKATEDMNHDSETEKMIEKNEKDVNKKSSEHDKFVEKKSTEMDKFEKKKSQDLDKKLEGSDDPGKDAEKALNKRKAEKKAGNSKADDLRKKIKFE